MNLSQWLNFLENRHQQEIQLGLNRIQIVANRLDLLHWKPKVITVAGTNGKGSTVSALETIYTYAGYQVGSYTSPHLLKFNERIRVNQQEITDEVLCELFTVIDKVRENIPLTYFEMTTLAALLYFRRFSLHLIILEVGMGGRHDATNIIDSDLAIITTIDYDHQQFLGNTIEKIAYEKAGILRKNTPFIYADTSPIPTTITEYATELNSKRLCYDFKIKENELAFLSVTGDYYNFTKPKIHANAAAAAIMSSFYFQQQLPININKLQEAIETICIYGRQSIVKDSIITIYDVAHNPQSVRLLAECVRQYLPKNKVHAVFSGLKDKDLYGLIEPMYHYVDCWYLAKLKGKRAASETLLRSTLNTAGCMVMDVYENPITAYQLARHHARSGDLIIVYGSFYTVGEVLSVYAKK